MRRRNVAKLLLLVSFFAGCSSNHVFEITWDEEVALHNGKILLVRVKHSYERRSDPLSLNRYKSAILRETILTFDAGPPYGVITQVFVHQKPMTLDTNEEKWFVILQGRAGTAVQNWGPDQNGNGQRTAHLVGKSFQPIAIDELPDWMSSANLLMDTAPVDQLVTLNGTRVTLVEKLHYIQKYPLSPIDANIARPRAAGKSAR